MKSELSKFRQERSENPTSVSSHKTAQVSRNYRDFAIKSAISENEDREAERKKLQ